MKKLLSIILLISLSAQAQTTRYVPKGTMPQPVYNLGHGDKVLFEAGARYVVPYKVTFYFNGQPGDSAVVGRYGTGPDPVITNRSALPNWKDPASWQKAKADTDWRMAMPLLSSYTLWFTKDGKTWEGDRAYIGSQNGRTVDSVNRNNIYASDATIDYGIYVYSPGVPPSDYYSNIEYTGATDATVEISGQFFKIDGLNIQGGGVTTVSAIFCSNFRIANTSIGWDGAHSGISFNGARDFIYEDGTVDLGDRKISRKHLFQQGKGDCMLFGYGSHRGTVRRVFLKGGGHSGIELLPIGSPQPAHYSNGYLYSDLRFEDVVAKGDSTAYFRAFAADIDSATARYVKKQTIRFVRGFFDSLSVQSQAGCEGLIIDSCTFRRTRNPTLYEYSGMDVGGGLSLGSYNLTTAKRMLIRNCAFIENESWGLKLGGNNAASYDSVTQNTIENCLFYRNGLKGDNQTVMGHVRGSQIVVETLGPWAQGKMGPQTFRGNLFYSDYPQNVFFSNYYPYPNMARDLAYFNSTGAAENGFTASGNVYADPQLIDLGGRYVLKATSPARGIGPFAVQVTAPTADGGTDTLPPVKNKYVLKAGGKATLKTSR